MTDEAVGEEGSPDDAATDLQTAASTTASDPFGADIEVEIVVRYLLWGALALFAILAVVAGVGLYSSLSAAIDVWVAERYRPLARAAFNFASLCVAVAGIVATLRRL